MNREFIDYILSKIHKAKELWIMAEGDQESMYEILNDLDEKLSIYAVDNGFVGKMSKSDGESNES